MTAEGVLVVGVGNPVRGDDGVGLEVARRLAALELEGVTVLTASPLELLDHLTATPRHVVVVDATPPAGNPGSVQVLEVGEHPLRPRSASNASSHGLGVVEVVELARALGHPPRRLTLVGVEAAMSSVGADPSQAALLGADSAVAVVVAAISRRP